MSRTSVLAAVLLVTLTAFPSRPTAAEETAVEVVATPIDRFDIKTPVGSTYGALVFRGGLRLESRDSDFGGLSGMRLSEDGARLTAISDRGNWLHATLSYSDGRLTGIRDAFREPIVGPRGPLPGKRGFDTEALEIRGDSAWIASERANQVLRFGLDQKGRAGAGRLVTLPTAARKAPNNAGFEAMATNAGGALVMIAEKYLDDAGDNRAFVVGAKQPFEFSVKRTDDFSPTDLVRLPGGGYALMERRFRPPFSLSVRVRRLAEADIAAGAIVDGPVLMEASLGQTIDNFEAIAVHRAANGATVLTMLSDDNFSSLQRTLLLQFELR